MFRKLVLTGTAMVAIPFAAMAQNYSMGEAEYTTSCAQCHGASGTGDGVMVEFLTNRPSDLTQLQKNNDGVFPVSNVYNMIEGAAIAGAHGSSEMPAWGQRYSATASKHLGWDYTGQDEAVFVRTRILALVEYISTLQEQ